MEQTKSSVKNYYYLLLAATIMSWTTLQAQVIVDMDNDGLDDEWEMLNGVENPFADPDEDQVLNLFEFLLGTDPNDASAPAQINVSNSEDLLSALEQAPLQTVIRVSEGDYVLSHRHGIFDPELSLMIQGGWDTDFTTYDPCTHPVTLRGASEDGTLDFAANDGTNAALVVEGILFTESAGGSALSFDSFIDTARVALYNCTFRANSFPYFSATIDLSDKSDALNTYFSIINCEVVQNEGSGVSIDVFGPGLVRLINSTIAKNNQTLDEGELKGGDGLDLSILADSGSTVLIENTILWGNAGDDFDFLGAGLNDISFASSYSNLGDPASLPTLFEYTPGTGDFDTDPMFMDADVGDFRLLPSSPGFQGRPNTFPAEGRIQGSSGYLACESAFTAIFDRPKALPFSTSVFPTIDRHFQIEYTLDQYIPKLHYQLLDGRGQVIRRSALPNHPGSYLENIDLQHITPGMYFIAIQTQGSIKTNKIIVAGTN